MTSPQKPPLDPLLPRTTLFVFAHPDDDTLVAGLMRELIERGAEVHGIWVTSGEHDPIRSAMRWAETEAAMDALGLNPACRRFLDLPFLALLPRLDELADQMARLLAELEPAQVFTVGFEGGHVDHDAVNFIVCEGMRRWRRDVPLYEFPLYNGDGPLLAYRFRLNAFPRSACAPPTRFVQLGPSALRHKYRSMEHYRSQWGFMATFRVLALFRGFARQGEPYRECPPDRDHTVPPHAGRLNIERWFNRYMDVRFTDFQEAVTRCREAFRSRHQALPVAAGAEHTSGGPGDRGEPAPTI